MNAILLVGGLGTRLRPLTLTQPKALLPVLNRPFLSYQLDLLKDAGVHDVMLASGGVIKKWEKEIRKLGSSRLKIHFSYEPHPLGTGGAIRYAFEELRRGSFIRPGPFLVFNGDVFFDFNIRHFLAFHKQKKADATLLLSRVKDPTRFGVVSLAGTKRVRKFVEKPQNSFFGNFINAGAYVLESQWIEKIPRNRVVSIERDIFPEALRLNQGLYGYVMTGYWNDIGTPQTYLDAQKDLLIKNHRWTPKKLFRKSGRLALSSTAKISKSALLGGFVCCDSNVTIQKNVSIKNSVLMRDVLLEEGAVVEGSILGRGCIVGKFSKIGDGTILGDKTILPPYTRC